MADPSTQIVHDDDESTDWESAYGTGTASSSASLTESILNYRHAHGRRYHSERIGNYLYPNDESEQNRMDLYHHIFLLLLDGGLSTITFEQPPQKVLDIGTGTGIWAIDFADQYPSAEVIGTDLSPIQPSWVPPNCRFEVDDCELPWTWERNSIDYIHIRALAGGVQNWDFVLRQAFQALKPGGWIELLEMRSRLITDDDSLDKESAYCRWSDRCNEASERISRPLDVAATLEYKLGKAGFTNIREVGKKVPLNPWPKDKKLKEIGMYMMMNMIDVVPATVALFTEVLQWPLETTNVLMQETQRDVKDVRIHAYGRLYMLSAQKPKPMNRAAK